MIVVVAGVIRQGDRVLVAKRPEGRHMGGKWEFPGGKLERGETPEQALQRELKEELDVESAAGRILAAIPYSYPEKDVLLLFYEAAIAKGEPKPVDEAEVRFVPIGDLAGLDLAPVDRLFVERGLL